ncbi:MAG TPA: hypothetical protein VJ810_35180, partial [Blastocatellia bacterium]|nr:hypothetical protein [Blastocatellia bacterium]
PRLGNGASPRQILEAVWEYACDLAIAPDWLGGFGADSAEGQFLSDYRQIAQERFGEPERFGKPERFGEFEADLSDLAALVDPDRFTAFNAYRGIGLIELATQCCVHGAGVAGAVKVARASLHISTGFGLSDDYICNRDLREYWNIPDVQAEARLQNKLARTLRATPRIGHDTVEALRRNFVT